MDKVGQLTGAGAAVLEVWDFEAMTRAAEAAGAGSPALPDEGGTGPGW